MTRILGLAGRSGAGKSTTCSFLQRNATEFFGPTAVAKIYHPADLSKEYLRRTFGIPPEYKDSPSGYCFSWKDTTHPVHVDVLEEDDHFRPLTVREFYEWWGTLVFDINPLGPILDVLYQAKHEASDLAVIDGVRRALEVEAIRTAGGKILRLTGGKPSPGPWENDLDDYPEFDGVLNTVGRSQWQTQVELVTYLRAWGWTK